MRITDAGNRPIVPLGYAIQQTHQTGVWDERADFRFIDRYCQPFFDLSCQLRKRSILKRVEVKPIIRREARVVLPPLGITLHPTVDVLRAVIAIQAYVIREMLEGNVVAPPVAVDAE